MTAIAGTTVIAARACSGHAQARMQQRAIPSWVVDLVDRFGEVEYHHGREVISMTRAALRRIERVLGRDCARAMSRFQRAYIVVDRGAVVTVAWRTRHFRRKRI